MRRSSILPLALAALVAHACGCARHRFQETPTKAGIAAGSAIDPQAQYAFEQQAHIPALMAQARKSREQLPPATEKRNALCLSGGGSYGAYCAGVLCGWSQCGGRPEFDVVTGISTGALIAPFAFIGSSRDPDIKTFFTETETRDIYTKKPVRGLFGESLADNKPLARGVDASITPQIVAEIACAHRKGRRLYVGSTSLEAKRFVVWDIGEIACRGTEEDRQLIVKILLGSSAIPGFFPPSEIPVTIDGKCYVEYHVDGGVSQSIFVMPPAGTASMNGMNVYCLVAGKLFDDAEAYKLRSLSIATKSVSTVIYAQTRGDLFRLWTVCQLGGMNYFCGTIPQEFAAPKSCTEFGPENMKPMFDEGVRQVMQGTAWRGTPPGAEPGEDHLLRGGTNLSVQPRR